MRLQLKSKSRGESIADQITLNDTSGITTNMKPTNAFWILKASLPQ